MGGLTGENFLPGSAEHVCAQQSPCGDQHPPHSPIYRRYRATGVPSPLSAAFDAPTHIQPVTTHSLSPNTRMLSSLIQFLVIEPLALVCTLPNLTSGSLPLLSVVMSPHKEPPKRVGKSISSLNHLKRRADAASSSYKSFSIAFSLHANVVVSHTLLDRISTDIMQHSPAARTWLQFEQRP